MKIDEKIIERFNDILEKYEKSFEDTRFWVSGLDSIKQVFGKDSDYYQKFQEKYRRHETYHYDSYVKQALNILKAAKDDYESGYFFDSRTLIEAEIFSDILEQAEELLKKNHFQAAAVVAGCVLEDGLRKLCDKNTITFTKKPTIEPMNVELAKKGIYNQFIKDKISSIGKLRNHAAHGEWSEFTEKDVEDMIRDVRRFMEDYFS